ncbi:MAG: DUF1254 domain-containing protein [Erythrobacter sp.]
MKRWIGPLAALVVTALAAHWATLAYAPGVIMDRALLALKDRGIAQHAFTTPQRITPQTQAVVRSSPDLFYSLCLYDLESFSFLVVEMSKWRNYQSLSFFDANTNNFATIRGSDAQELVMLVGPGETRGIITTIESPTKRGVILIRRLAPDEESFASAKEVARNDQCALGQDEPF